MSHQKIRPELVPQIRAVLSAHAPLPQKGILAGQSLANAILEVLGKPCGPYNDIDVFVQADAEKLAYLATDEHRAQEALNMGVPVAVLDEYRQITFETDAEIKVAGTERDGLLNYVWLDGKLSRITLGTLISSFDLNSVEVALDLESNELVWSKAFEYFVDTRQLEVTNLNTPARTLVRFLKKLDELNAYADVDTTLRMLVSWMDGAQVLGAQAVLESTTLHPRYAAAMPLLTDKLPSWLKWDSERNKFALSESWVAEDFNKLTTMGLDDYEPEGQTRLIPQLVHNRRHAVSSSTAKFIESLKPGQLTTSNGDHFVDCLPSMSLAVFGHAYLQGQRSAAHLELVERTQKKHRALIRGLMGLTLDEQYNAILDIRRRAKIVGEHRWGQAEAYATPADLWCAHARNVFFQRLDRISSVEPLIAPLFAEKTVLGVRFRELVTEVDLRVEGSAMQHCVGGYGGEVESGRSRILSLRSGFTGADKSTVELSFVKDSEEPETQFVWVAQHHSVANKPASELHAKALEAYLEEELPRTGLKKYKKKVGIVDWDDLGEALAA